MVPSDDTFKANRDWLAGSFVFAVLETGFLLAEAMFVMGSANYVSSRTMPYLWRSWFGFAVLLGWMYLRFVPLVEGLCSFRPSWPSRAAILFMLGLIGIGSVCQWAEMLSVNNLVVGGKLSWSRLVQYVFVLPLEGGCCAKQDVRRSFSKRVSSI